MGSVLALNTPLIGTVNLISVPNGQRNLGVPRVGVLANIDGHRYNHDHNTVYLLFYLEVAYPYSTVDLDYFAILRDDT